jgi:dUTP pyrophosphatase
LKLDVKIKKLNNNAQIPTYGSRSSAGADLYAYIENEDGITIDAGQTEFIHTGISIEFPDGYVALVYARSGLACKQGLAPANKVGVVDSDYRGEIIVALHNHSSIPRKIKNGDRIAQIVFAPYYSADFTLADELSNTERGTGGFGSTGI